MERIGGEERRDRARLPRHGGGDRAHAGRLAPRTPVCRLLMRNLCESNRCERHSGMPATSSLGCACRVFGHE